MVGILRIPFFIDIAVRAIANGAQFETGDTEIDFRRNVWSSVIAKDQDRKSGMPLRRRKAFIEIATQRAKKMVFGISADQFDPEVISKLEEDNLIYRDPNNSTISLPHDVLEDWALEEFIEEKYTYNIDNLDEFLSAIGNEPAISRAFRLWLYRRLQFDVSTYDFVEDVLSAENIETFLKDETIGVVAGGIIEIYKQNQECKVGDFNYWSATPLRGFHKLGTFEVIHGGGGNFSTKKEVLVNVNGIDENLTKGAALYEETDFCLRVKQAGYIVMFHSKASVNHLAAETGGCRVPDIKKYIASLVRNRSLIISRHVKGFYKITATLYLLRLVSAYAFSYKDVSLFKQFITSFKEGFSVGKKEVTCTKYGQ